MSLPRWVEPQLSKLATKAPRGSQWSTRSNSTATGWRRGSITGIGALTILADPESNIPAIAEAFAKRKVKTAFIDREFCGVRPDGVIKQQVSDSGGGRLMGR
jgi:hypothetical protein